MIDGMLLLLVVLAVMGLVAIITAVARALDRWDMHQGQRDVLPDPNPRTVVRSRWNVPR